MTILIIFLLAMIPLVMMYWPFVFNNFTVRNSDFVVRISIASVFIGIAISIIYGLIGIIFLATAIT